MQPESPPTGIRTLPVSCDKDCGAGCPLLAHVKDGLIVKITNNPAGTPYMQGCGRGFQAMQVAQAPDRLLKPLIRSGPRGSGDFKEASWDEALDRVAQGLVAVKQKHGNESILLLGGSGACRGAMHNTVTLPERFLNMFGGYTEASGNYSSGAYNFIEPYVFGTSNVGMDAGTLQHSKLIVLWGANILDTRFGCELPAHLKAAAKSGVPVVVIDPRKSRTAGLPAVRWIPIRPGTDTAMMAAVLYKLIENDHVDIPYLEKYCLGFEQVKRYILGTDDREPKTPAWAQSICATPAAAIEELAELYGRTKPAALIPGLSIQRNIGGEEAMRMAVVLQAATGNIGKMGGASGGLVWNGLPEPACGSMDTVARADNPSIPGYRWPDAILEGRKGGYAVDIVCVYNVGGNYLSQGSDIKKNIRAFKRLELAVCHDIFMTPTARHCDIILPTTTFLEREDILFPGMNYLFYSSRAMDPPGDVKDDYDIFCALAERLGYGTAFSEGKNASQWLDQFAAQSDIDDVAEFKQTGIFSGQDQMRVGLSDFVADPVQHPLGTPSGKIELASRSYAQTGFAAFPTYRGPSVSASYPLRMVTPHSLHRINSSYSNVQCFREREPQVLWMNPLDAEQRDITDGQKVSVSTPQGKVVIGARVTVDIMPGVVCLLQGVWPQLDDLGVDRAGAANVLTCTEPTLPSNSSRTHSIAVEVGSCED